MEKSTTGTPPTGTLYWYMTPGIVAESDLNGNLTSEYVFFNGTRVARRDNPGTSGPVFYYFSDHLKTTDVVTNAQGTILNESDFYPWGGELKFLANDANNHYKFTGKERDSETQLDYFGARYYSNGLGRWISADWSDEPEPIPYAEIGDPQTLSLYSYVRNIPTTLIDFDGHLTPGCKLDPNSCALPSFPDDVCHFCLDLPMLLLEKILPGNALSASYFANKNKVVPPPPAPNTAQGTQSAPAPNQNQNQGPKKKIVDAKARKHILDGDETGGGHRAGTGTAGKSEFPANWSDDKIIQEVESVANDSTSKVTTQGSTKIIQGTRDGVDIKVVERNNRIVTGYPTSVPRNP